MSVPDAPPYPSCRATGLSRGDAGGNGRMGSVQCRFPMRGAERKPFGADDFDVGDADEGEDRAQILLLEVVRLERHPRRVKTTARRGNDHALPAGQPDRPVRRVAEGLAGNRDAVDPCLELAWDAKVIHRCADDEDVSAEELVAHVAATLVCNSDRTLRCIRWSDRWEALAVKVRDRVGVEVTPDHFETWDGRFQCSDQRRRELARSRVGASDAGVDMEEFHGLYPWSALARTPKSGRYLPKNVSGVGWTPA